MGWLQGPNPSRWWCLGWWQSRHNRHRQLLAVAHRFGAVTVNLARRPGNRHSDAITLDVMVGRMPAHALHSAFNRAFSRHRLRSSAAARRHGAHGTSKSR